MNLKTLIVVKKTGDNFIRHLYEAIPNLDVAYYAHEAIELLSQKGHEQVIFEWGNDLTAFLVSNEEMLYLKKLHGSKFIVRIHDHEVTKSPQRAANINYDNVDLVFFINPNILHTFTNTIDSGSTPCVFVPNAVSDRGLPYRTRTEKNVVGMLSIYVRPRKGFENIIHLADQNRDKHFIIRTHLPKPGERFSEYYSKIRSMQMSMCIDNVEWRHRDADELIANRYENDDLGDFYNEIDVIASTSSHEGFHYALAEGMMCGCEPLILNWPTSRVFYGGFVRKDLKTASRWLQARDFGNQRSDPRSYIMRRYDPTHIWRCMQVTISRIDYLPKLSQAWG